MVEHHNKDREDSSSNSVRIKKKIKQLRTLRKKRKGRARVYLRLTY